MSALETFSKYLRVLANIYTHYARMCVQNSQKQLFEATLKNVQLQGSKNLESLTKGSPRLESLTILTGGELGNSLIRALTKASNLRILRLMGRVRVTMDVAWLITKTCPQLTELCHGLVEMTSVSREATPLAPHLESLSLFGHNQSMSKLGVVSTFHSWVEV